MFTDEERLIASIVLGRVKPSDTASVARLLVANSGVMRGLARRALRTADRPGAVLVDTLSEISASGKVLSQEAVGALQIRGRAGHQSSHSSFARDGLSQSIHRRRGAGVTGLKSGATGSGRVRGRRRISTAAWGASRASRRKRGTRTTAGRVQEPICQRSSAVQGLRLLGPAALPALLLQLPHAKPEGCAAIIEFLGKIGFPELLSPILLRTASGEPVVRVAAIRALAQFDTPEATRALSSAAASPNWRIRRAAMEAIGHWQWANLKLSDPWLRFP